MNSYILDIQRCSVHDGPGIRTTVFFKGCPLKCKWCHNPESQCFKKELSYIKAKCTKCGKCAEVCPNGVHTIKDGEHIIDYTKCISCGKCVTECQLNALEMKGKDFNLDEVMKVILQDTAYYKKSKGGVTLSGGEVLSHTDASLEILKTCKRKKIHTCIETSGLGSKQSLEKIIDYVDLFLYDYKHYDEEQHKKYIGCSRKTIIDNLEFIQEKGKKVILRCPIIPSVNDVKEHFDGIIETFNRFSVIESVEILPYHNIGTSKAKSIGMNQDRFETPSKENVLKWNNYLKQSGINVIFM